jgi:amino acid transporter, AAT family
MELQRGLKHRHIGLIALGGIIGSSYFLGTGYLLHEVGPCAFLAYALGGLISYLTLACLAELAVASPAQGSFVHASAVHISPSWACGVGWSYWFSWVIYIPSECIGGALILSAFIPEVPHYLWALLLGSLITLCNIAPVKTFGESEFWLALIKILLLIGFCVIAFCILRGWITSPIVPLKVEELLNFKTLFPHGLAILFINMVILMANFQGSEIIGLTASETKDPKIAVPNALRKVSWRIIGLYIIPTFLLVLIFPWKEVVLSDNAFSVALEHHGLKTFAQIFSLIVVIGAISSANSGLYATIRTLFAMGHKKIAPNFLTKTTKKKVPINASLVTIVAIWILLLVSCFSTSLGPLYAKLLAASGFTGSVCWISICWSELRFRKNLKKAGATLTYKVPFFPYITYFAIWIQVIILIVVLLNPTTRPAFYFGAPALLIPIIWHKWKERSQQPPEIR